MSKLIRTISWLFFEILNSLRTICDIRRVFCCSVYEGSCRSQNGTANQLSPVSIQLDKQLSGVCALFSVVPAFKLACIGIGDYGLLLRLTYCDVCIFVIISVISKAKSIRSTFLMLYLFILVFKVFCSKRATAINTAFFNILTNIFLKLYIFTPFKYLQLSNKSIIIYGKHCTVLYYYYILLIRISFSPCTYNNGFH